MMGSVGNKEKPLTKMCKTCGEPVHEDCHEYNLKCSAFGCGSTEFVDYVNNLQHLPAVREENLPVLSEFEVALEDFKFLPIDSPMAIVEYCEKQSFGSKQVALLTIAKDFFGELDTEIAEEKLKVIESDCAERAKKTPQKFGLNLYSLGGFCWAVSAVLFGLVIPTAYKYPHPLEIIPILNITANILILLLFAGSLGIFVIGLAASEHGHDRIKQKLIAEAAPEGYTNDEIKKLETKKKFHKRLYTAEWNRLQEEK